MREAALVPLSGRSGPRSPDDKLCQAAYAHDMATMNVSLPDALKNFVEAQVRERGYGTSSEFVRELIRKEQARSQLRALVTDGLASGDGSQLDDAYLERLRQRVRASTAE